MFYERASWKTTTSNSAPSQNRIRNKQFSSTPTSPFLRAQVKKRTFPLPPGASTTTSSARQQRPQNISANSSHSAHIRSPKGFSAVSSLNFSTSTNLSHFGQYQCAPSVTGTRNFNPHGLLDLKTAVMAFMMCCFLGRTGTSLTWMISQPGVTWGDVELDDQAYKGV